VKTWMQENRLWLFIYDNAENEKSLEKYCSSSWTVGRHILVTSRNRLFQKFQSINISVFNETEACKFIEKYTNKPADEYFKVLAEKMGYLPLALDQAGAFMNVHSMSYRDYLDLYDKFPLDLLSEYDDDDPDKKTVATTWQISFDKIENPASRQLLYLCAFFSPDNFHPSWIKQARTVLPDELRETATHELKYEKVIAELTKYSLVSKNEEGFLSIHRLVQEVIRDSLHQEQSKWRNYCVGILHKHCDFDFSTSESRALFLTLTPHIVAVTQEIDEEATEKVAKLYSFLGCGFDALADYPKALEYNLKVLTIREKVLGKEHPSTYTSYNNIGFVYDLQGNYGLALEYYMKALSIREKVLGDSHPSTALSYNNIGLVHSNQGNYDLALEYYMKALSIKEKVLGDVHPDTAYSYNNIGGIYDSQGNYDLALEYYVKTLAIFEKVLGDVHPDTALSYNNIGGVYHSQGNYDLALEYYMKSLSIREKVLGAEHPDTALSYNNIGAVYSEQGNYDLALEYSLKALSIKAKVFGDAHPETARSYNNIGAVYSEQGNYDLALEYYMKALFIREKVLGDAHPDTASSYNNIGVVHSEQGDYDLALEYYMKSLSIREKALGDAHPSTKLTFNNLTNAYEASGNPEPFEEWLKKKRQELQG